MKVIKTREQARIDQSKHDKWIDKNLKCPECNKRVMDDCIERRIFNKFHMSPVMYKTKLLEKQKL